MVHSIGPSEDKTVLPKTYKWSDWAQSQAREFGIVRDVKNLMALDSWHLELLYLVQKHLTIHLYIYVNM